MVAGYCEKAGSTAFTLTRLRTRHRRSRVIARSATSSPRKSVETWASPSLDLHSSRFAVLQSICQNASRTGLRMAVTRAESTTQATRLGLEPRMGEPKSPVLPLHHRVGCRRLWLSHGHQIAYAGQLERQGRMAARATPAATRGTSRRTGDRPFIPGSSRRCRG